MSARVNDVHSRLNETTVGEIVEAGSVEVVQAELARARDAGRPVSIAGGRHAMGGQQFCSKGVLLDTRPLSRVLSLDHERGLVEVEAGIQWPELIAALAGDAVGDPAEADRRGRLLRRWRGLRQRPRPWARVRPARRRHRGARRGGSGWSRPALLARGERRSLPPGVRRLRPVRGRVLRDAQARPSPEARAGRAARRRRGARRPVRPAHPRRLPLRRLPVRDRSRLAALPAARRLLLLPARARRDAARRRDEAERRGLERAPAPRPHGQGARVRALRGALPLHVGPGLPLRPASARELRTRLPLGRLERDDHRALRSAAAAGRLPGGGRTRPARARGRCGLRHRPSDRARRRVAARLGARALGVRRPQPPRRAHARRCGERSGRVPAADRPRARAPRELLPDLPPLGDAATAARRLPAAAVVPRGEARVGSRRALPERLVPVAPSSLALEEAA